MVPTTQAKGTAVDGALAQGPVPLPVVAAPAAHTPAAPPPANRTDVSTESILAVIAGLLVLVALVGAGAIAILLRRRNAVRAGEELEETCYVPEPVEDTDLLMPTPMEPEPEPASTAIPTSTVLGDGPVPTDPDERDALVERMIAAPPDAGNPFTTRKARRRRALIQLRTLEEARQQSAEATSERFDWRTYRPATKTVTPAEQPERESLNV